MIPGQAGVAVERQRVAGRAGAAARPQGTTGSARGPKAAATASDSVGQQGSFKPFGGLAQRLRGSAEARARRGARRRHAARAGRGGTSAAGGSGNGGHGGAGAGGAGRGGMSGGAGTSAGGKAGAGGAGAGAGGGAGSGAGRQGRRRQWTSGAQQRAGTSACSVMAERELHAERERVVSIGGAAGDDWCKQGIGRERIEVEAVPRKIRVRHDVQERQDAVTEHQPENRAHCRVRPGTRRKADRSGGAKSGCAARCVRP